MRIIFVLVNLCLATACGQTGPLYMPDEGVQTPVEIRSPASPPPTPAAEPAPERDSDDEAKKSGQPAGR